VIHYSQLAAHRASRVPLLGAIATLTVIAIGLGDPQAGAGTTAVAGMVTLDQPTISTPTALSGPRPDRLRNPTDPAISALPHGPAETEHLGIALFNRDRAAAGQPLLSESRALDVIAATRAQQMVVDGLTHLRPGSTVMAVSQLLQQNGIAHTWDGENIYWIGGSSVDDAVTSAESWWMSSPEHRDNILASHFRQVGIGTAIDGAKIYVSAVFTD
jgi:uncharacterized protein YkwD